jgi:hypothetical protein
MPRDGGPDPQQQEGGQEDEGGDREVILVTGGSGGLESGIIGLVNRRSTCPNRHETAAKWCCRR